MSYYGKRLCLWRTQSSRELLDTAIDLHSRHSFSWWDSLIVSAAIQGGNLALRSLWRRFPNLPPEGSAMSPAQRDQAQ